MNFRKIKRLVQCFDQSSISELEVSNSACSVRIKRMPAFSYEVLPDNGYVPSSPAQPIVLDVPPVTEIMSPCVGMFYRKSNENSSSKITVGKRVKKGDTIGIIKMMKTYHPVLAEVEGVIDDILVEDEQPVEYDQPLFIIS